MNNFLSLVLCMHQYNSSLHCLTFTFYFCMPYSNEVGSIAFTFQFYLNRFNAFLTFTFYPQRNNFLSLVLCMHHYISYFHCLTFTFYFCMPYSNEIGWIAFTFQFCLNRFNAFLTFTFYPQWNNFLLLVLCMPHYNSSLHCLTFTFYPQRNNFPS